MRIKESVTDGCLALAPTARLGKAFGSHPAELEEGGRFTSPTTTPRDSLYLAGFCLVFLGPYAAHATKSALGLLGAPSAVKAPRSTPELEIQVVPTMGHLGCGRRLVRFQNFFKWVPSESCHTTDLGRTGSTLFPSPCGSMEKVPPH